MPYLSKHCLIYFCVLSYLLFSFSDAVWAGAQTGVLPQTGLPQDLNLDLRDLNRFQKSLDADIQTLLPSLDPKSWGLTGPAWDLIGMGRGIARYFVKELVFNLRLAGELLLLALALAILQNIRHAFEAETVNRLAFGVCFMVVIGLVFNSFRVTLAIARDSLTEMNNFMYAILPLLFSLTVAGGGVTTTTIVHPVLMASIHVISGLVANIIFPLIIFAGVLGLVNYLVEGFPVSKLASLFKSAALGLLGVLMAVFIGITTVKGFAGSIADTTALRTAKYFSNTFLPVVGGVFSDTMEMAVGCSRVLKCGLGIYGLGLIVLITVFPLIKILTIALVYHVAGAVAQPLGEQRLADALQGIGGTFLNMFGAVAIVGLMFFIAVAILVGLTNFGIR